MMTGAFHINEEFIQRAYEASGNKIGWRFLSSSYQTLHSADIVLVTLNPGGDRDTDDPRFCMPEGNAYIHEAWDGKEHGAAILQRQVQTLFKRLDCGVSDVLSGHFVPWRSKDWALLEKKDEALAFGESLWSSIFSEIRPRLVVGLGTGPLTDPLARALNAGGIQSVPIGWGDICARKAKFDGGDLIVLPHLSHFKVMNKAKYQPQLLTLFGEHWHP